MREAFPKRAKQFSIACRSQRIKRLRNVLRTNCVCVCENNGILFYCSAASNHVLTCDVFLVSHPLKCLETSVYGDGVCGRW